MSFYFLCLMSMMSASLYASQVSQKQQTRPKIYAQLEELFKNTGQVATIRALTIGDRLRRDSSGSSSVEFKQEQQNPLSPSYILAQTPKRHEKLVQAHGKDQSYSKKEQSLLFIEAAKNAQTQEELIVFLQDQRIDLTKLFINQQDGDGKTALMYVTEHGLQNFAEVLMEKGARAFSIKDFSKSEQYPTGKCAYDYAAQYPKMQLVMAKRQEEDRQRRNLDIQRRSSMSDIFELYNQPMPQEDYYMRLSKLPECKEHESSQE